MPLISFEGALQQAMDEEYEVEFKIYDEKYAAIIQKHEPLGSITATLTYYKMLMANTFQELCELFRMWA